MDSRPDKNNNKRNENSKSWYENETGKADSSHQKISLNLTDRNLEKIHNASSDRIPKENIAVKGNKKSGNQEDVECGQPSPGPGTPQADR